MGDLKGQSDWRNLVAACGAITVFGLAFGMTYPLLSLILESRGVDADMIGLNSAMMPIGILLYSSQIPRASRRFGGRNVAIVAAIATSVLMISLKIFDDLIWWFPLRLLMGMSTSTLFVLSEAWIVRFAGSRHRGRVVAIYGSVLAASFGAGPALIGWIGIDGWMPFVVASLVILAGVIPLWFVSIARDQSSDDSHVGGILIFARKAPLMLVVVGVFAVFDAATLSLLPVYGLRTGLDVTLAATALTALIVGNIFLQLPIGSLADRFSPRPVLLGCAALTGVLAILMPFTMNSVWMWPLLILIGASGYGIYTVVLATLGTKFSGEDLVTGSAAFAVMWGIGALLGSILGGWSMTLFGPHGLPMLLAVLYLALFAGLGMTGQDEKADAGPAQ
ncbi:MAG: MFS transporter [marine bacterium B5-7]|nr:MAG: MFS transporter [marine bacterium B5-7]